MKPTPAVASEKMHKQEQEKIMIAAIGLPTTDGDSSGGGKKKESGRVKARLKMPPRQVGEPAS
jgi:hypothetical protein